MIIIKLPNQAIESTPLGPQNKPLAVFATCLQQQQQQQLTLCIHTLPPRCTLAAVPTHAAWLFAPTVCCYHIDKNTPVHFTQSGVSLVIKHDLLTLYTTFATTYDCSYCMRQQPV
jgi:hypothetical protein